MNLRDLAGRLDRLQKTRGFKLIATGVIAALAVVLVVGSIVDANRVTRQTSSQAQVDSPAANSAEGLTDASGIEGLEAEESIANTGAAERMLSELVGRAATPTGFIASVGVVAGVLTLIVWLGVGLTYLGLLSSAAFVIVPLGLFESTRPYATFVGGVSSLIAAFTILLRGLSLLLGGKGPVLAIARNVLAEAVRLKLSLVFIVLLVFGLAALPGVLDESQPLRYRVQSFLQYGTGGTFWIIAILVVAFSVSTVASEQRDKVIWQTITKPVAAWQYILGKWLGVVSLAALLLAVNAAGVFLFVEYLRNQPAENEREAFVATSQYVISEDRVILESEILTARRTVEVTEPPLTDDDIAEFVAERVDLVRERDPTFEISEKQYADLEEELRRQWRLMFFRIPSGAQNTFLFENTGLSPDDDVPVTLYWRIDAGANRPDEQYRVGISVANAVPMTRTCALGVGHSVRLTPSIYVPPQLGAPAMLVPSDDEQYELFRELMRFDRLGGAAMLSSGDLVDEDGTVRITFVNGAVTPMVDPASRSFQGLRVVPNPDSMQFPAGSL
ncbi:MAG: hypothetical protein AAFR96_09870, partial [Planctomycetota bacterium]